MRNKYKILLLITLFLSFWSCQNVENGQKSSESPKYYINKIKYRLNNCEYFKAIELLKENKGKIPEIDYLWYLNDIYYNLINIYEIGFMNAINLQNYNYSIYLKNIERTNKKIAIPSLYFLLNNYLINHHDSVGLVISRMDKLINESIPLYSRYKIMRQMVNDKNINHTYKNDILLLSRFTRSNDYIQNLPEKVAFTDNPTKPLKSLRTLDTLFCLVNNNREPTISELRKYELANTFAYGIKIEKNVPWKFRDIHILRLYSEIFKKLFQKNSEKLLNVADTLFDDYTYERAGWAFLYTNQYETAYKYFEKWKNLIKQRNYYSGKSLLYEKNKYKALISALKNPDKICQDYASNYNFNDALSLNKYLTYFWSLSLINSNRNDEIKDYIIKLSQNAQNLKRNLNTGPVNKKIYLNNIILASFLLEKEGYINKAKILLEWVNEFTNNYDFLTKRNFLLQEINTNRLFSMLPYGFLNDKKVRKLIIKEYEQYYSYPTSIYITPLLKLREKLVKKSKSSEVPFE